MPRRLLILLIIGATLTISQSSAQSTPAMEIFNAGNKPGYISSGRDLLCLDYMKIIDNHLQDYEPAVLSADVWLIIYRPDRYAKKKSIREQDWMHPDEVGRFKVPGPDSGESWQNGSESVFKNFGLYQWNSDKFDSVVFRIAVGNPAKETGMDTILWGVVHENQSFDGLSVTDTDASVIFRTTTLPEYLPPPAAIVNSVKFVHNVTKSEVPGMEMVLDFEVDNLRTEQCRLAVYIHNAEDSSPVKCETTDSSFRTSDGYLTVQEAFIPLYITAKLHNFALFVPYAEFPKSDEYSKYYAEVHILGSGNDLMKSFRSDIFEVRHSE